MVWLLPCTLLVVASLAAIPLSRYLAWIMEGGYRAPRLWRWIEERLDSGPQTWLEYGASLLIFNTVMFVFAYLVLLLQPWMPNPDGKGMLAPSTIFHSACSFITNTDLQHYAGEVHLSNFSQIFFGIYNLFLSPAVGLCAFLAIIRALRGDARVGNYFLDMWRAVVYAFLPLSVLFGLIFLAQGSPMTFQGAVPVQTLEGGTQTLVLGPVAAFESIKMLGTNGGGFYGMNSAHPFENPTALTNFFNTLAMMLFPYALVLLYGHMLRRMGHARVIFAVMLLMMAGTIAVSIAFDTLQPNPALTGHAARTFIIGRQNVVLSPMAPLPVDQHLGNLEGKEMRFGTSAGATYAAVTTDVACGAVNAETDSLTPAASLGPLVGMWLNCLFGGKGVGMINMLVYIVVGIFLAGMMVGRTPEYLGRKIGAREIKLAVIALLIHPLMILAPTGWFAASHWGLDAVSNPGPHGFTQMLYQFSSASANNGSAFDGLGTTYGFAANPHPAPTAVPWDVATGLVMLIGRFMPILAPLAMAGSLGAKTPSPAGGGTLRDDTGTFAVLLLGTILIVGALLFLPVAVLGPVAEHFGPMPFGGGP